MDVSSRSNLSRDSQHAIAQNKDSDRQHTDYAEDRDPASAQAEKSVLGFGKNPAALGGKLELP